MQSPEASPQQVFQQVYKAFQRASLPHAVPIIYLSVLITGFTRQEILATLAYIIVTLVVFGAIAPYMFMRRMVFSALAVHPGEPNDARLKRILKLPLVFEFGIVGFSTLSVAIYATVPALVHGKSLVMVPLAIITVVLLGMMAGIRTRLLFEGVLRPLAIREFQRNPGIVLKESGFLWLRFRWYLPMAFGLFMVCALLVSFTVLGREAYDLFSQAMVRLDAAPQGQASMVLKETLGELLRVTLLPVVLLNGYLLVAAGVSALSLARYVAQGARSVQDSMVALASGTPKLPEWTSTDEIGDLAAATAQAFAKLRDFSLSLRDSAGSLRRSAEQLGLSTTKQTEVLTLQATALQETQVTAQEIKETSAMATQKAENVLRQTERANEISQVGERSIERTLEGLKQIQGQVREMASRIRALDERARQIAKITDTVKLLADRSNMLALNAAIEAVRSGEHGKGFGVVAREIRQLADQSIKATHNVRDILEDISEAIRSTATMTEQGSEKVESSLVDIREFGETIQQLSSIVRENAHSVRQITTAVTQQSSGITQIFQAVNDLTTMMDQTMSQLNASMGAVDLVRDVSYQVSDFLGSYGWEDGEKDSAKRS